MKFAKLGFFLGLACHSLMLNAAAPGTFEPVPGSPFAAGAGPGSSSFSPLVSGSLFCAIPNYEENTVSAYQVDQSTGVLIEVSGSPFPTGGNPAWQVYSPLVAGNLFSAVANFNDNTVSVYAVDQTTGTFREINGSPFSTGAGPYSIEYSPVVEGNLFAAVANSGDNTVSIYQVDPSSGVFKEVAGSPLPVGNAPYMAMFSPVVAGNLFAGVANYSDNTIGVYRVDQQSGAFTPVEGSPFSAGINPYTIAFSPQVSENLFAAAVNLTDNTVSVYRVDTETGAFKEVEGSPFKAGTGANEIAFSPDSGGNLFAAVVNFASSNVSVYQVNESTGVFNEVPGSPFPAGVAPDGIAFSSIIKGRLFAVVGNFSDNTASVFQVVLPPYNESGNDNQGSSASNDNEQSNENNGSEGGSGSSNSGNSSGGAGNQNNNPGSGAGSQQTPSSQRPTISSIVPPGGPTIGGTSVVIVGQYFTGATSVDFGGFPATSFTVISDGIIHVIVPASDNIMSVEVTVSTQAGKSLPTIECLFSFLDHYLFMTAQIK